MQYQAVIFGLLIACTFLGGWVLHLRRSQKQLRAQNASLRDQLEEAVKRLAELEKEPKSKTFNKLVNILVAAGVPGLVFVAAVSVSGFYGAAAITTALAGLGGPWGMMAGVGTLILLTAVLSQFDVRDLAKEVMVRLLQTKSKGQIIQEIGSLPGIVPNKYRAGAKALLETM